MSWVVDARKLMQDFVAPELRAITVRMDAADKLATERHSAVLEKIESVRREVSLQVELAMANRRIEELQARQLAAAASVSQTAIGQ